MAGTRKRLQRSNRRHPTLRQEVGQFILRFLDSQRLIAAWQRSLSTLATLPPKKANLFRFVEGAIRTDLAKEKGSLRDHRRDNSSIEGQRERSTDQNQRKRKIFSLRMLSGKMQSASVVATLPDGPKV